MANYGPQDDLASTLWVAFAAVLIIGGMLWWFLDFVGVIV